MGIDISGGMIVGANCSEVEAAVTFEDDDCELFGTEGNYYEEFYEWYEAQGLETYSYHYDASSDNQILGFTVSDVDPLSPEFSDWVEDTKDKAHKFYQLTGIKAELIGMQDVY
ncbi:hypothetical protein VPIG_00111 [Vibrio phage PWH3a-P1]|uniref:hypothetical protein n=1 Tax=Vibrio phage PWH3a-P1 TaxID=754058 RepID=UPI0002C0DBD8|nr:hypothetical protein VPIG_00111 [Vibrio phage PWH3a-P1]AGH31968.1 hypothetical protein VPIG_00111 [Vibrio phage PWH3a-P1]